MIETRQQFGTIKAVIARSQGRAGLCARELIETIEALRPFVRSVREERIVPAGSHVSCCTFCHTSWLNDPPGTYPGQEHHETTCLLYGIPRWLADE